MITEDYVSFETAKLLKEKGFEQTSDWGYREDGTCVEMIDNPINPPVYWGVTLQMVMKWLREVHKLFIQVELYSKYEDYWFELFQNTHRLMVEHREVYSTYEEAAEAAIKYCLENLI